MKIADANIEVHQRGVGDKVKYRVAQNAKIMKMLSDSLYSDKIRAVLRELGTNAMDGHVKVGNTDTPFKIWLPTKTELEFKIKDYGSGMDRKQLTEMYTTYGDSDKTDSNDYNGCMGIGSKSPFAYTNAFTTTSIKDGLKYVCVNAKDEDGIPTLSFMLDGESTDEPNGIEITFAVKSEDTYEFTEKAASVYHHFPVRPDVERSLSCSSLGLDYEERKLLYQGDGWRIFADNNDSRAVMGYVAYPIEANHFSKSPDKEYYSWRNYRDTPEATLIELGVELDFGIGEIDMDISRENLQYNKTTINAVKERLQVVLKVIESEFTKSFDNCKSLWEARMRYQDLTKGKMSSLEEITKLSNPVYDDVRLDDSIYVPKLDCDSEMTICRFDSGGFVKPKRTGEVSYITVPPSNHEETVRFYLNDLKRGSYAACQRVIIDNDNECKTIYLVNFANDKAKADFCKAMGFDESYFHKTSEIPKPTPDEKIKNICRDKVFLYKLDRAKANDTHYQDAKDWWTASEVEFDDGGVYIEINRWWAKPKSCKDEMSSVEMGKVLRLLEMLGVTLPEEVVGIKTAIIKRYHSSKKWEDVCDWVKRKFDEYLAKCDMESYLSAQEQLKNCNYVGITYDKYTKILDNKTVVIAPDSPLTVFVNKINKLMDIKKKHDESGKVAKVLGSMLGMTFSGEAKDDLKKESSTIEDRYEMLSLLSPWDVNSNRSLVARYINIVDSISPTNCEGV